MAEFCTCGSLKIDGKCTAHKGVCPEGAKRRRSLNFGTQGYIRSKKTGALMDKETGTLISKRG